MIAKIARFRVKEGVQATVEDAIRDFVAAIRRAEPNTEYRSFRVGDGRDYLHVMAFPDAGAEESHRNAEHTDRFVQVLYRNCEAAPEFADVTLLASSR